jgi:hypothetical protein
MTPAQLPAFLKVVRDKAATTAPGVSHAMSDTFMDHLVHVTLRQTMHAPFTETPSPPGRPPAWVTGRLAGSVTITPGVQSGIRATNSVGPHIFYASVQEFGGDMEARHRQFMRFLKDGEHFAKRVHVPKRPYMEPALEDVIQDGTLQSSAIGSFANQMATVGVL